MSTKRDSEMIGKAFQTTNWKLVANAAGGAAATTEALTQLYELYWMPLYAYLRRNGQSTHDAQDLLQSFFSVLIDKDYVRDADQSRGKFRSFLLASLKHFAANERAKSMTKKRGGDRQMLSLDNDAAEKWYLSLSDLDTPERVFDRGWALTVLARVMDKLQQEYKRTEKAALFDALHGCLTMQTPCKSHAEIGAELSMTPGAVKVAIHRLRRRYRKLLENEIAATVSDEEQIRDEIRVLQAALQIPPR